MSGLRYPIRARTAPSGGAPASPPSRRGGNTLTGARQLAPQVGNVVLVQLDLLLVRLEAVEHALVVALAAQPLRLLLREFLARLVEKLLLVGQFLLQDPAALGVAVALGFAVHPREVLGRLECLRGCPRGGRHRIDRHLDLHQAATLGFRLDVGETLVPVSSMHSHMSPANAGGASKASR